ncbi:hypothetical protein [Enterococcus rivorum]|uniref:Uncharacterized protein n=1 Tax=Enterococcus rivorum TaxID=762845 RepID=A0A1E5KVM4_9ENTE|nr:hypothetical protein [Enterococcus rivorum]MBP2099088.1 FlaA1/EpsC-like NDP-sugar epimerase [Enterococcus rivorum]OEH81659.1 hypothetical protein BCR26_15955 [Enterococcus rivorum]
MKKTADDFYYFILSIKYGLQILSVKATKTIINIAIVCFPIMFFYVLNVNSEDNIIPFTMLLKSLSLFFFTTFILYLFSFLFVSKKIYESIIWFLASISSLLLAYVLIIFEYSVYLFQYFSQEQQYLIFNFILLFPLFIFTLSLTYYIIKISSGKTHKNDAYVIDLEEKYKNKA